MNSLDCFCYSACHSYWNHSECNNLVGNISRSPEVSLEMTGWHCPILYVVICANPRLEIIVPFKGNRINPCIRSVLIDQAKAEYMTNTHWKSYISFFIHLYGKVFKNWNALQCNPFKSVATKDRETKKKETMEKKSFCEIFSKFSASVIMLYDIECFCHMTACVRSIFAKYLPQFQGFEIECKKMNPHLVCCNQ